MTTHIGFRCPEDIIAAIKERSEASGKGRTDVLVEMLRASMPSMLVSDRSKLPQDSAIYFVWNEQQLLYIGKTVNLRRRFSQHHRLADFALAGAETRISWLPATVQNLAVFERSLIEELEPEINRTPTIPGSTNVVTFRFPPELEAKIIEQSQEGESFNETARRILIDALGGRIVTPPAQVPDVQEMIAQALTNHLEGINNRIDQLDADAKLIAEHQADVGRHLQALDTESKAIAKHQGDVDRRLQGLDSEIKVTVEAAIEEKLAQTPVQKSVKTSANAPTQTQFHELKERVNDFRASLHREIKKRDETISLLAEQIAELTMRLDTMPVSGGINKEDLETAKETVLKNWRISKSAEKKERIGEALDKLIDIVSIAQESPP
jgi:hypothetical protein